MRESHPCDRGRSCSAATSYASGMLARYSCLWWCRRRKFCVSVTNALDLDLKRVAESHVEGEQQSEQRSGAAEHGTALYIQENHKRNISGRKATVAVPGGGCEEVMLERPFREDALMGG